MKPMNVKKTISESEFLFLHCILKFEFLISKWQYHIVDMGFQVRGETWIIYESKERKRLVSLTFEDEIRVSISKTGNMFERKQQRTNLEIITVEKRDHIKEQLAKEIMNGKKEKVISFYSGYIQNELDPIIQGEKWF